MYANKEKSINNNKKQWFGFHISNHNLLKRGRVPVMPIQKHATLWKVLIVEEILGTNIVCGCLPTAFVCIYAVPSFEELTGWGVLLKHLQMF